MSCDIEEAGSLFRPLLAAAVILLAYIGILAVMQDHGVFSLIVLFPFILAWLSHCFRLKVSCKAVVLLLLLLFMFEASFARNYMMRCYEEWPCLNSARQRGLEETNSSLENTVKKLAHDVAALKNQTSHAFPHFRDDQGPQRTHLEPPIRYPEVCFDGIHDCNAPELPKFHPFGLDSVVMGGRISWSITCPHWTCTMQQQPQKNIWLLWEYFFVILLTTAFQLLPNTFFCCLRNYAVQVAGAGTCQPWLIWLWLSFLVEWAVLFVLMADDIKYRDFFMLLLHTIEYLLRNTLLVIEIGVFSTLFVVAYYNRVRLASFLGVEGQNVFRFGFSDIFNPGWRRVWKGGIQVCIWKVTAFQHDLPAPREKNKAIWGCFARGCCGTLSSRGGSREYNGIPPTIERTVDINSADEPEETQQLTKHIEDFAEQNFLGERGKNYDIFVRLNLGDNEPRATIVHYAVDLDPWTEIIFNEPFKFFFCPDQNDELCVYVRDQGVATSCQLGVVKFDCKTLQDLVRENERMESDVCWKEQTEFNEGQAARRQVRAMLDAEGTPEQDANHITERMKVCGFKRYNLDFGGSIWLAFAKLRAQEGVGV